MAERVAVTGIGVVSPIGIGRQAFWEALVAGESGIAPLERTDGRRGPPNLAARVRGFIAKDFISPSHLRRMDDLSRMVVAASRMALDDAGIDLGRLAPEDVGAVVGSALGDVAGSIAYLDRVFTRGPAAASPMAFPNLVLNAPASYVAMETGATGANFTVAQGEISGEQAILLGADLVRSGRARVVVAGGGDQFAEIVAHAYGAAHALSGQRGGREWCSPYDPGRNGIVLGEGAAMLLLEPLRQARERGAAVYAELEDGMLFTVPSPPYDWPAVAAPVSPPVRALLSGSAVDIVVGCANSSHRLDEYEIGFLEEVFRETDGGVEVTSIKGAVGEFGAAGAFATAAACLALGAQVVPPLCHLTEAPPSTRLRFAGRCVTTRALERALVCGFARGGSGVAILLRCGRSADPDLR
jgi:3-oxoacyl-[acyl-carrier-protein] synthase II